MAKYSQNQNFKVPSVLGVERTGRIAAVLDLQQGYVILLFPIFVNGKLSVPGEAMTVSEEWLDNSVVVV